MNKTNISPAEYLKKRIKVWCHNRNEWEIDELSILESGDFIDRKNRLHRKENHTAYVTLEDALAAIEMTMRTLLDDAEAKIETLKSENKLLESLKILSEHQEELARDSTPGTSYAFLQSITQGSTVTLGEMKELLGKMAKQAHEEPKFNKGTNL